MTAAQHRYVSALNANLCGQCKTEPRSHGVLGARCWARNTRRNRRPRVGVRRKRCAACLEMGHFAKTCGVA